MTDRMGRTVPLTPALSRGERGQMVDHSPRESRAYVKGLDLWLLGDYAAVYD